MGFHTAGSQRLVAALCLSALALAGCDRYEGGLNPGRPTPAADIRLEVSALDARVGDRIGVGVAAAIDGRSLLGLQGRLRFDPASLRYVGQVPKGRTLTMVNDGESTAGLLRLVSVDVSGLPARTATLVFEVTGRGYASGLSYELDEAVLATEVIEAADVARDVGLGAGFSLSGARRMTMDDWGELLYASEWRQERHRVSVQTPGQYLLNLRFGDANLSGTITASDAVLLANVAVGNVALLAATNPDPVIAGNVVPFNAPGLGEPGDSLRPGTVLVNAKVAPGDVSAGDVVAVNQEAVGIDRPVVGELIPGRGPLATNRINIPAGTITTQTWTRNNIYQLDGIVRVDGGAVLTIEAGTRIEGNSAVSPSALFIHRDGRIVASGTALEPIVFSCTASPPTKGCWGGLVITGYAPINEGTATSPPVRGTGAAGCLEQIAAEGNAPTYGGCDPADSSGVLRYVRSEFGGHVIATNNELNGITLNGVGDRTVIENVQVHGGLDDGMEFFGGTVNVRNVYLTANSDDQFDFSFGWSGKAQFVIAQADSLDADKGIEADNTETVATYGATPRTNPQLFNFTFVGKADVNGAGGLAANNVEDALHLRRGTGPSMTNFLFLRFKRGLDIDDGPTCTGINGAGGLQLRNSILAGLDSLANGDAGDPACPPYASVTLLEQEFITDAANANAVVTDPAAVTALLRSPLNVIAPDFRPNAGQAGGGATPPADGFFDVTATYIGGAAPVAGGGGNVPWYAGWTRGWRTAVNP